MAGLLAAAVTVARPEGVLLAVLVLVPVAVDAGVPRWWRGAVLAATGAASLLWHVGVLTQHLVVAITPSWAVEVLGLAALGGVLVLVALALPLLDRAVAAVPGGRVAVLVAGHAALWLVAAVLTLANRATFLSAVDATLRNVLFDGLWGVSLAVLVLLLLQGAIATALDRVDALLFGVVGFVPLGLVLGLVRGGSGYRVGAGDSLNRMIIHVVPLAVLAAGLLVGARSRSRWPAWLGGDVVDGVGTAGTSTSRG